jgi:hypothetical protein
VNTLEYNKDQDQSQIGPEAQHQWDWLEASLNDSSRHFLLLTHIYAGNRISHSTAKTASTLWMKDQETHYFDLFQQHQDRIILEVAGHDHWGDVRYNDAKEGVYRNMFIPIAVGMNQGNLPGFSTFTIDKDTFEPSGLEISSLDIQATYGLTEIPPLSSIPKYKLDFNHFGIDSLSATSL